MTAHEAECLHVKGNHRHPKVVGLAIHQCLNSMEEAIALCLHIRVSSKVEVRHFLPVVSDRRRSITIKVEQCRDRWIPLDLEPEVVSSR